MQQQSIYHQINDLINTSRLIEAENLLDQIPTTEPSFYMASFQRGYIRQIQGRMEDAKELYLHSLSINSTFEQARQFLARLNDLMSSIRNFNPEPDEIYAHWYNQVNNWGDILNVVLIEMMSGKKVVWVKPFDYRIPVKHLAIGSMVRNIDSNTVVWGTGAISEEHVPATSPKKVCAVRGPLTRQFLIGRGIECPEVYGDPALLYPRFYDPDVRQEYDLGIVAHFADKQHPWLEFARSKGARIIDIQGEVNQLVDEIKSCARIASSSLHGIIAADAYGIPSSWVEFSDKVIGNGYKFRDYYQSINRSVPEPVQINSETSIGQLDEGFNVQGIDIDLDLLFDSCPFLREELTN